MIIDIRERTKLTELLHQLTENTPAQWGLMQPQNMVEHLAMTLQYSNGKKQSEQKTPEPEAQKAKAAFIYTDVEMPKGLKSSLAGETADPYLFSSLEEAKKHLYQELDDFESFFALNPTATFIQPRLGRLNYQEWIILHNKHFTHHFKQFGLI